ncbi:MAG: histone deacetylase [Gemmatimonadota bacterium]|nr:histone deacetylase [Gemmatimonadota bacterium]MDH3477266.1 histone deacetylase [Gemmatimonadota bacterium]MDH5548641.1 histone deacetylase [Gemmatimonadota bacterium]
MSVHIVWHPSSQLHDAGPGHPESPARTRSILERLRTWPPPDHLIWHEAAPATERAVLRVHTAAHLDRLQAVSERGGGRLDADTSTNQYSLDAALHAAGAAIMAVGLALETGTDAFVPVRPPGHHATAEAAMGFCLLNNVVIAAMTALEERSVDRILIVDWDVHHGNGTQALVERESRIRYVSLHQWPLYPGTGLAHERGVGNVFNVPRPPDLPRERYVEDLDEAVTRATDAWAPDLLLISAGFDAMAGDPLAGFTLEPSDFATWIGGWRRFAVPIVSVLEGGYVPDRIADAAAAHVRALTEEW